MIEDEDSLEEELLHEFEDGTLEISPENKLNNDKQIKPESPDKPEPNKGDNYWSSNFITPLTSIPNKITASIWCKNPKTPTPTKENTIQQTISITENPYNYFTFRESVLARALGECKEQFLDEEVDGPLTEAFLLTQISHWNSDKERLVLLTPKTLVICKYDFIALKRLAYKKLPLEVIDQVIYGELVYPSGSLIPQMNGFVNGLSNVLETCLFARWSKRNNKMSNFYQPRSRNMKGVRLLWNKTKGEKLGAYWNPFKEDVPFCTFTFHPLFFHKDCVDEKLKNLYSLDTFIEKISKAIADLPRNNEQNQEPCTIQERDIVLKSYVGIGSVIHNRNSLGFFKVRGKFSF
ncbi:tumor protein p63-regulated gene 1-like protein isoform X2 [Tribolium castaneum]|uniref:Tumor protein p63-regulated gene 1-like protein n=1 Tax=Tribolium castaneum TaxID=7070 RepID=D6X357_TRICA|nr:PREDICTED: tumor protein p63-regulated gene 1-like protein isoform X1 [Tribolium castaneum]EFA10331.1 Tumor protein p63-regulated gene 1-like protein [Tribolium castaneum]|eukprot:XP_971052.1 PREDICTED: tumor protein p63-regulated gene 1-like protein isoform X1 [Tribolium castaneum]